MPLLNVMIRVSIFRYPTYQLSVTELSSRYTKGRTLLATLFFKHMILEFPKKNLICSFVIEKKTSHMFNIIYCILNTIPHFNAVLFCRSQWVYSFHCIVYCLTWMEQ